MEIGYLKFTKTLILKKIIAFKNQKESTQVLTHLLLLDVVQLLPPAPRNYSGLLNILVSQ